MPNPTKTKLPQLGFSVQEVADYRGVDATTVRKRIRAGEIRAVEAAGRVLVISQDLADKLTLIYGSGDPDTDAFVHAEQTARDAADAAELAAALRKRAADAAWLELRREPLPGKRGDAERLAAFRRRAQAFADKFPERKADAYRLVLEDSPVFPDRNTNSTDRSGIIRVNN
jgi:excisionase family DNA binding protein